MTVYCFEKNETVFENIISPKGLRIFLIGPKDSDKKVSHFRFQRFDIYTFGQLRFGQMIPLRIYIS